MKQSLRCFIMQLLLVVSFATVLRAQWIQTNGPHGGPVYSLAVSGTNVFAATSGGVFRSSNNGTSWTAARNGLPNTIPALAVSGTNVFAGTNSGVYLSTDNGTTWTAVNVGLTDTIVLALAVYGTNLIAGTDGGVYLSTDGGSSWTHVNTSLTNVRTFAISGTNLFAATWGNGVFLSTDNGTSWTAVNSGLTNTDVRAFAVSGTNLFAGTFGGAGVYLSTNNGTTWTVASAGLTWPWVDAFAISGTDLFAGTWGSGVYRSTDNGANWAWAGWGLTNWNVAALAVSGTNVLASAYGVFVSTDNGTSWTEASNGLANGDVRTFAVSGTNLFAGTSGRGVFLSTDDGTDWTVVNNGLTSPYVSAFAVSGTNLFAGTSGGVFLSSNNGTSWAPVNDGLPVNVEVFAFAVSGTNLFAGTNTITGSNSSDVFLSTNNGAFWSPVSIGLVNSSVRTLAISGPSLFAGTLTNGVFLSTNNGTSWTAVNTGLTNISVRALAVSGTNLFAGTYGGIFLSTNNGANWTRVDTGLTNTDVRAFSVSGTNLFAGTYGGGVFLSTNNGTNWTAVNTGLWNTYDYFNTLAVSGTNLFAGTYGAGAWRRPLSEMITIIPPSPPINLFSPAQTTTSISISWTPPQGSVIRYFICAASSINGPFSYLATTTTTSYTHTGLSPQTTHWYYVIAYNSAGNSPPSSLVQATTQQEQLPAPYNLIATDTTSNTIGLRWASAQTATSYNIYARKSSQSAFRLFGISNDTVETIGNLDASTQYVVRVSALRPTGESPKSDSIVVSTELPHIDIKKVDGNPFLLGISYPYPSASSLVGRFDPPPTNLYRIAACADGVSKLIIVINSATQPTSAIVTVRDAPASNNPLYSGTLSRLNESPTTNTLFLNNADFYPASGGQFIALVAYTPPLDFVRPNHAEDDTLLGRNVNLGVDLDGDLVNDQVGLVRPPLVLAHGIWVSTDTWNDFYLGPPYYSNNVFRFDYSSSNAAPFATNVNNLYDVLSNSLLPFLQSRGFACTQVDYVGHSMGGILARLLSQDIRDCTDATFGRGYFHKLITLDTPHFGTRLTSYLVSYLNMPPCMPVRHRILLGSTYPLFVSFFSAFQWPVPTNINSAIYDLSYGGGSVRGIHATPVPSHSLVGTTLSSESMGPPFDTFLNTMASCLGLSIEELVANFHCEANDLAVSRTSQLGQIPSQGSSEFFGVNHLQATSNSSMARLVKALLDAVIIGNPEFQNFPNVSQAIDQLLGPAAPFELPITEDALLDSFQVQITNPSEGAQIFPGGQLSIHLAVQDSMRLRWVSIVAPGTSVYDTSRSLSYQILTPYNLVGDFPILVVAGDSTGAFGVDSVRVTLQPSSTLLNVTVTPDSITLYNTDIPHQLTVRGFYSDNSARDLTFLTQTSYEVLDTSVVSLPSKGLVAPKSAGQTIVRVLCGGLYDSVHVTVVQSNAVLLLNPQNGSTNISVPQPFRWRNLDSASSYHFELSRFSDFSNATLVDTNVVDTVKQIDQLRVSTFYFWRVRAKKASEWQPWSSTWTFESAGPTAVVSNGWNLISVPITVPDTRKSSLFPSAVSLAFTFTPGGYVASDTMANGLGYWLKFGGPDTISLTGDFRSRDSVDVRAGWNLIGSITNPVLTGAISSLPPAIVVSNYYGYGAGFGYTTSDTLKPGKGYWVKTNSSGRLILENNANFCRIPEGGSLSGPLRSLRIVNAGGLSQTLWFGMTNSDSVDTRRYEMPPAGPIGMPDIRFASNCAAVIVKGSEPAQFPVLISSAAYPITITWEVDNQGALFVLRIGDSEFAMNTMGSVKVSDSRLPILLKVIGAAALPKQYVLSQNYPNPFNPSTTIKYDLPKDSHVSLKLFNILGQEVATLVNEDQKAGYKSVEWNANNFASGVYFCRIQAGDFVASKKLLMLK